MLVWALAWALAVAALRAAWQQRAARQRAEQLLQYGQIARLNTLGELAAGMAHELNQPLTAILSNSQAARRLLDDAEPDVDAARQAMQQAAEQAKRASAVIGRLRRLVERPDTATQSQAVPLPQAVADALHLLEPELRQRQVQCQAPVPTPPLPPAQADPIALQQILHNLLLNALQAMEQVPAAERQLLIQHRPQGRHLLLTVQDNGPGIAPELRERLFTPFATTRAQGLGLGLTLSQGLAESMGGQLRLVDGGPLRGACFELQLPAMPTRAADTP
jgi:C4-dicarboxylate-specific signal transduction histidine kinase